MQKKLIIVRGCLDSGKKSIAKKIDNGRGSEVSASYFEGLYINGIYQNEKSKNSHDWCKNQVERWMSEEEELIIVHNLFSKNEQLEPYLKMAAIYGYVTQIILSEAVILPSGDRPVAKNYIPQEIHRAIVNEFEYFNIQEKVGITLAQISEELENAKKPEVIIFDMDWTIKRPLSGTFPSNPKDFELTQNFRKWMLSQYKNEIIYIVTNQFGVSHGHKEIDFLHEEVEEVVSACEGINIRGVYASISDDECLFYNPLSKKWRSKCKTLWKDNLEDIKKPGVFTFKDIVEQNRDSNQFWIVGDSHTDKNPTDWLYAKNCKSKFNYVNTTYVPIEMLNTFCEIYNKIVIE